MHVYNGRKKYLDTLKFMNSIALNNKYLKKYWTKKNKNTVCLVLNDNITLYIYIYIYTHTLPIKNFRSVRFFYVFKSLLLTKALFDKKNDKQ